MVIDLMNEYGSYAFLKNTIPNLFAEKYKKNYIQYKSSNDIELILVTKFKEKKNKSSGGPFLNENLT